jgi:hypothetical protein
MKLRERKRSTLAPIQKARLLVPRHSLPRLAQEELLPRVYSDLPSDVPVSSPELEAIEIYLAGDLDALFD